MTFTVAAGAMAALAAIVVAAAAMTIAPAQAEATPQLAAQTKFPCGQCRVSLAAAGSSAASPSDNSIARRHAAIPLSPSSTDESLAYDNFHGIDSLDSEVWPVLLLINLRDREERKIDNATRQGTGAFIP